MPPSFLPSCLPSFFKTHKHTDGQSDGSIGRSIDRSVKEEKYFSKCLLGFPSDGHPRLDRLTAMEIGKGLRIVLYYSHLYVVLMVEAIKLHFWHLIMKEPKQLLYGSAHRLCCLQPRTWLGINGSIQLLNAPSHNDLEGEFLSFYSSSESRWFECPLEPRDQRAAAGSFRRERSTFDRRGRPSGIT